MTQRLGYAVKCGLVLLGLLMPGLFPAAANTEQQASAPRAITRFHGMPVPDIVVSQKSGRSLHLSDLRGRIVILNVWATWCVPCRAEMPTLERLAARDPNNLVVLAVSIDEDGWPAVDQFWKSQFPHLRAALASSPDLPTELGALGVPYSLVVGRDGREIARVLRGAEWDRGELAALVTHSVSQDAKAR